jgi:hypothetical protein
MKKITDYITNFKKRRQLSDALFYAIIQTMSEEERKTFEDDLTHTKMLYFIFCFDVIIFLLLSFYCFTKQ